MEEGRIIEDDEVRSGVTHIARSQVQPCRPKDSTRPLPPSFGAL